MREIPKSEAKGSEQRKVRERRMREKFSKGYEQKGTFERSRMREKNPKGYEQRKVQEMEAGCAKVGRKWGLA
jgi:hypothetical protein